MLVVIIILVAVVSVIAGIVIGNCFDKGRLSDKSVIDNADDKKKSDCIIEQSVLKDFSKMIAYDGTALPNDFFDLEE